MEEAAEGHFTTEALQWNQDKSPTISGKVIRNLIIVSSIQKVKGNETDCISQSYKCVLNVPAYVNNNK